MLRGIHSISFSLFELKQIIHFITNDIYILRSGEKKLKFGYSYRPSHPEKRSVTPQPY